MTEEAWVESQLGDGTVWRWTMEPDSVGVIAATGDTGRPDKTYPVFVLSCGDRRREAFVSVEIQQSPRLRKSVYGHMAMWGTDGPGSPCLRAYGNGRVRLDDGTWHRGLCLFILDMEGSTVGGFPVPLADL